METIQQYRRNPWIVCLLPFVVYMLVGSFEPSPPAPDAKPSVAGQTIEDLQGEYQSQFRLSYALKIGLTLAAVFFVLPGYRGFPWRLHFSAIAVGLLGVVVWVALAKWQHHWMPWLADQSGIEWLKSLGQRSGNNLLSEEFLADQTSRWLFFALRLFGLAVLVPIIEEFFIRGFLMRFVMGDRWWEVPFGTVNRTAVIAGTLVPILMHPQEALAALAWFSMVTWLMIRTRSIGDCILAHAVTNLAMAIYVISSGDWWLM
jgi:CAAX prenyl protease-like protein